MKVVLGIDVGGIGYPFHLVVEPLGFERIERIWGYRSRIWYVDYAA